MKAFFGRSAYLTYFAPTPNKYQLKNFNNNSIIKEMNKYYEDNSGVLSNGEGGLSSFRISYDNKIKIKIMIYILLLEKIKNYCHPHIKIMLNGARIILSI